MMLTGAYSKVEEGDKAPLATPFATALYMENDVLITRQW
jgi:hypothetical protein